MPDEKINIHKIDPERIVILGGGFGGVRAALDLGRKFNDREIILIDKNNFHSYTSDYYELATALFGKDLNLTKEKLLSLKSTVAIPFGLIFKNFKNIKTLETSVLNVDFKAKKVKTNLGVVNYNFLILALGSETNFYGIPHLSERALELKRLDDALNIRAELDELFQSKGKHDVISFVIGGGGFTGSELAGELAFSLKKISAFYSHPVKNISITVVEAADRLLSSSGTWFSDKALKRLKKLGVRVNLGSAIKDIKGGKVILKSGDFIAYDLLIWTAGVRPCGTIEAFLPLKLSKNKCIVVNENLETAKENVFAIGDLAYFVSPGSESPIAMTAQAAIDEGRYAALYIAAKIEGRKIPEFHPKLSHFIIPLGGKYALADLGFIKISGFSAWFLKRITALKYFMSILPVPEAFKLWRRGLKVFMRND